ncbi:hypothetical protein DRV85_01495 [Rhodosalinus halophilus]|uniref:Maspardin n=1 Tax=Rhodosalinus halophilus TaxID=2259333 RepID=A0A365UEB7_9RHOB|nr:alpha/beta hydrolase [Rhodosalinus halophilus]RBI87627.1 hypothetical protein DRV85_01495 [Rhodosalinus halophilus]
MTALIEARDAFAAAHPEGRVALGGRDWGVIEAGAPGASGLLLIPGTLGRADIFWQQIAALESRLHLLAVSYPATGDIGAWTRDLLELTRARGMATFAVLGSSLGGYLAQALADSAPDRVSHLFAANTLASAAGLDQRPPYSSDLDAAPIERLREGFAGGLQNWAAAHPEQAGLVALLLGEVGGRIPEPELRMRLKALKQAPELGKPAIDGARTTVIEAADDPLIPAPMREGVRARLRPGVTWRFRWGGHFPYVVRPLAYTGVIERTLGLADPGDGVQRGALREL